MEQIRRYFCTKFVLLLILSLAVFQVHAECHESAAPTTPSFQFTDLSAPGLEDSEVIEDFKTGLMWERCFYGSSWSILDSTCEVNNDPTITWKEALKIVDQANTIAHLGYTDWRMPNIKELASIVERQCYLPAINSSRFPLESAAAFGVFWSSTPVSGGESIRVINFADGQMLLRDFKTSQYFRLVRDITP